VAGLVAQHFRKATVPLLIGVVLMSALLGGLGELAITGSVDSTIQDFTIGWPGMLFQIVGTYLICKYL
jgi:hypothetical protein